MLDITQKYFTEESSIHGVRFVADSRISRVVRFFWLVTMLGSFAALCLYGRGLYVKLTIEPEIGVQVNLRPMIEFPFPAVTICAPVFARDGLANLSDFAYAFRKGVDANLSVTEQNYLASNFHACVPHLGSEILKATMERDDKNVVKLLQESSLATEELLITCSFRRILIACEKMFNRILTDYGYCFSFNMQGFATIFHSHRVSDDFHTFKRTKVSKSWLNTPFNALVNATIDDERVEWTLEGGYSTREEDNVVPARASKQNFVNTYLFLNDTDASNVCTQVGKMYKVIFHLPSEIPTLLHEEHFIEFDHQKTITLRAEATRSDESLRKFSPEKRRCYFEGEKTLAFFKSYTKAQCDFECMTNYTLGLCGCVKFSMPRSNGSRVCTIEDGDCYYRAMLKWPCNRTHYDNTQAPCQCLPTCSDIKYGIASRSDTIFNNFNNLAHLGELRSGSYSYLIMQFKSHLIEETERYAEYTMYNFIADCGGLLGLFLGCSLLSIIELAFFVVFLCSQWRRGGAQRPSEPLDLVIVSKTPESNHRGDIP